MHDEKLTSTKVVQDISLKKLITVITRRYSIKPLDIACWKLFVGSADTMIIIIFELGGDITARYLSYFFLIFNLLFIYYFYFWLCWVFVSVWGLSPVAASGGHSSSQCAGLSLSRPLLLWSTGSRRAGSVVVAHGPSCSAACGIFPDQGSNPCPLHWQADSQPLRHQGSPARYLLYHQANASIIILEENK